MEKGTHCITAARNEGLYSDPILNVLSVFYTFTNIGKGNKTTYFGRYRPSVGMIAFPAIIETVNKAQGLARKFYNWNYKNGQLVSAGQTEKAGYMLIHRPNGLKVVIDPSAKAQVVR